MEVNFPEFGEQVFMTKQEINNDYIYFLRLQSCWLVALKEFISGKKSICETSTSGFKKYLEI